MNNKRQFSNMQKSYLKTYQTRNKVEKYRENAESNKELQRKKEEISGITPEKKREYRPTVEMLYSEKENCKEKLHLDDAGFILESSFYSYKLSFKGLLQKYSFILPNKEKELLFSSPKVAFRASAYHYSGNDMFFYKWYLIAPELLNKKKENGLPLNYPPIYLLTICYDKTKKEFYINYQADLGGYEDALVNLMCLDYSFINGQYNKKRNEDNYSVSLYTFKEGLSTPDCLSMDKIELDKNYKDLHEAIDFMLTRLNIKYATKTQGNFVLKDLANSLLDNNGLFNENSAEIIPISLEEIQKHIEQTISTKSKLNETRSSNFYSFDNNK